MRLSTTCAHLRTMAAIGALIAILIQQPAKAADANEAAAASKLMWRAFECATYAASAGDSEEQRRLFTLGYEKGKLFIDAARAGKITQEQARQNVYVSVSLRMAGPTTEFILGRMFEAASDAAFTEMQGDAPTAGKLLEARARDRFHAGNCELLD